ncbi:MAG: 1-acyl-sn-glycerol-3-phosphate acyltransferase [Promicromonosporaceae bacterium]|nr:1-acyl-sn-glycerol-3-phosphate acyltransferase [Promicromonosporaceae bacterium]
MPKARPESRAYRVIAWIVRHLMFAVSKPEWTGTENLPTSGGFIAAANHATEIDALTFAHFLFDQGHEPRILAKRGLFTTPVIGSLLRATRMIPVDRGTADAQRSLDAAQRELEGGACVAIFPEGTLTRDPDLWPMEGKTGLARLALSTRQPVVPIAQWGAGAILARYGRVLHPFPRKRVQVAVGPVVDLSDLYGRPLDSVTLREATTRVMDAITRELEPLRGEKAPAARFDLRLHPEHKKKQTVYPPVERP